MPPSSPKPKQLDQRRWEYRFVDIKPTEEDAVQLSKWGSEGWRVVHVIVATAAKGGGVHALLERPVSEVDWQKEHRAAATP